MAESQETNAGLLWALGFPLDGGAPVPLDWPAIREWDESRGFLWIHLQRNDPEAKRWLHKESRLSEDAADLMFASATRPRVVRQDGQLFMTMRAVNVMHGEDPEDLVSIRLWLDPNRLISLRREQVRAAEDVYEEITKGKHPVSAADVLVRLAGRVTDRIAILVDEMTEEVDQFEDLVLDEESQADRRGLAATRKGIVALRRYVAPQRDALNHLASMNLPSLAGDLKIDLDEVTNKMTRLVEDLAAAHDRAIVLQDAIANQIAEATNQRIYVLTILTGIFLPLSLLTGLLGINVAGIPWAGHPWAFAIVCLLLVGFGLLEIWILRRLRWF